MRIISGQFRRKPLAGPPAGATTRPMPDRVKLAIFNLLRGHPEDGAVIDLFAGTGAMGLEAASLGSPRVVFVEKDRRVVKVLEKNIESVGAEDLCDVVVGDALGPAALTRCPRPVHLIFMDPPYELARDPDGWARIRTQAARLVSMLDDTGYLVLRTPMPFYHVTAKPGDAGEGQPDERSIEIDLDADDADDALDAFEAEFEAAAGLTENKPVDPIMEIDNAVGPETHDYGTTAVHLYMKRPVSY